MEHGIAKLKRILEGEGESNFDAEMYMRLYTTIYNMCTQKPPHDYSEPLYKRYGNAFSTYITDKVMPALKDKQGEYLLKELLKRWANHKVMVRWLSRFFNYLDRYYISRHSLHSLKDVGLLRFRDEVYVEMKRKAKDAILELIEKEREGEQIERLLLKNVLDIFMVVGMNTMDCYEADFEAPMLVDTAQYYKRKAAVWIEEDSCPDYMVKAEENLKMEEERVTNYLHASSKSKLLHQVETEVLIVHQSSLLEKENSGCSALLQDDKKLDLARMFRLFSRTPKGLEPVADAFRRHVEGEGMKLLKEAAAAATAKKEKDAGKPSRDSGSTWEQDFVRQVIELHDKYMQYVIECFANSSLFHKALKEAFESFCNKQVVNNTSAELMANFCDNLLKKGGGEKLSDDAIESTLDKVVKLLAYISDKDLFSEFYRKKLARRLLFDKSASDDHERSILGKLKQQCGAQFTSKMEGMVNDLHVGREKQQQFDEWKQGQPDQLSIDLSVTVLTTGFWPSYKAVDLALPEEMVQGVECFKRFFEISNKHRKLTWMYALGTAHLRGSFDAKPIELVLTTFQAAILLLFNTDDMLSYNEVRERVNLPDDDIMRLLHSLSCAKYRILNKAPVSKTISKTDTFSFNNRFTDKMRRIKIPLPPVDEKKKVIEDVTKDRRYSIDAAIVRTMKSRKMMQHQQLTMEVVQQLSRMFQADFKLIKKRIEDLMQREYLDRDRDNPNMIRYLA